MNETLKVLKERRSVRKYKAEQIRDEELKPFWRRAPGRLPPRGLQTSVMVVVQDPETIAWMSKLNAEIQGQSRHDPFYGAPTVVVVLGDGEKLELAAGRLPGDGKPDDRCRGLGLGSAGSTGPWSFLTGPEGKELLKKWGLPETCRGVGNCILGYVEGDLPAPKPGRTAGSSACNRCTGRREHSRRPAVLLR